MQNMEFIYGRRPIFELLQAGKRSLHKLWIAEGTERGVVEDILRMARERGVPIERTRRDRLDRMIRGHHQGLVAQTAAAVYTALEEFIAQTRTVSDLTLIALDELQDPQNIGAILRSAAFFGVQSVIVPRWRSAPIGEAAARASSGAIERLQFIRAGNLVHALDELREAGFEIVGAEVEGTPLWEHRRSPRTVLVVGNEGKGLRRLVREHCDKRVGIPRQGRLDSLNVGAATAIFLYEFFRNR